MKKVLAISSVLFVAIFLAGCGQQPVSQTQPTTPAVVTTPSTEKSLEEYFATREQFLNSEMPKDNNGMNKTPEVLGFNVLAKIEVTCPDSAGTPCGGDLLILSKDALHSGNQDFFLAFTMLPGAYTYYGPFTDDLQRIVNESNAIGGALQVDPNLDITVNWETYTDTKVGFTFKYPPGVSTNGPKGAKDLVIGVTINDLNTMEDMPSGYDKANALKDKTALSNNDPSTSFGWAVPSSLKMLSIPNALAKELTILGQIEVCDVQFNRQAIIYKDNYQIILSWMYAGTYIKEKNPSYFKMDSSNCGSDNIWKDGVGFYADLVAGKTDSVSQNWFISFDEIIKTFQFTK